ncbi:flavodoxin-dependent (E)-4-hydroxy-3-methylbut-2-enyl-diphosphate synthase [Candidatus Mesenet endosymbiont of Agriotes lineatus]|uniref:flavodoxin-dependent (E)-4-hydroxy-3-methylbut-2-enyl-diphosphate synthase n=1 Tax=Candidatus Mesenet endosymbiont of Agriotes lineatus TaxID=3077948 RepID=UPI0030CD3FA5
MNSNLSFKEDGDTFCYSDELYRIIPTVRHRAHEVKVGKVRIGGSSPVVVQSMALGPVKQPDKHEGAEFQQYIQEAIQEVVELAHAGSELVRIALNSDIATKSVPYIRDALVKEGFDEKMIVGCGQYELDRLLVDYPEESKALGKIRINPGNVGFGDKRDEKFERIIEYAIKYDIPVRIGVNWGSLDKYLASKLMDENAASESPQPSDVVLRKALVMSALNSAKHAEKIGLSPDKIVISCKVSKVQDLISVYTALAKLSNYALHLGLTEAGGGSKAVIGTASGLSYLLQNGIGDTIRASLTQRAGEPRTNEVKVCQEILQAIGLRHFEPQLTSCPGCGRTNGSYFRELAEKVDNYMKERMPVWKEKNPGVEYMNVAVMGCVVNGPGESRHANLGISLPGYGEKPITAVYADGKYFCSLKGSNIFEQFTGIIEDYVSKYYVCSS